MKRLKRIIGSIYMGYLMRKGVSIKELYENTKRFHKPKSGWFKDNGVWRYYGEDDNIY